MNSDALTWEPFPGSSWYWYFAILFLVIFGASVLSDDMKRRNKIIFATISLTALLVLPVIQRVAIQAQIKKNDYHLIVDQGIIWPQYTEADPREYLWRHFFQGVWVNVENKLIYISYGKTSLNPQTIEEIQFLP